MVFVHRGIKIHRTYSSDFQKIYPLLQLYDSPFVKEDWENIFIRPNFWDKVEDYVGLHMTDGEEVVGFIGLIFSRRKRFDSDYIVCNTTSLIVKEGYRHLTMLLLREIKTLKWDVCTAYRPMEAPARIYKILGFKEFSADYTRIPVLQKLNVKQEITVKLPPNMLEDLEQADRKIIVDHIKLLWQAALFSYKDEFCYIIYRVSKGARWGVPLNKIIILHISNINFFNDYLDSILKFFRRLLGVMTAIYVTTSWLRNERILAITKSVYPAHLYESVNSLQPDELYSEAVLLVYD